MLSHAFSVLPTHFLWIEVRACDGHSNILTLLSLSHFATTLEECLGSLSIWKTHLRPSFNLCLEMLLQYIHIIFLPHDAIYFVKCTSPSCSKAPPHHDASRLGWCSSACKHPHFYSKHNNGHYGQTVLFLFHQTRGHFFNKYDLCPHVQLQTVVRLFYGGFGAVASSLLSGLSGYVDIGLVLLWILLYMFPPGSSQGPLLLFWD